MSELTYFKYTSYVTCTSPRDDGNKNANKPELFWKRHYVKIQISIMNSWHSTDY